MKEGRIAARRAAPLVRAAMDKRDRSGHRPSLPATGAPPEVLDKLKNPSN
jgi:hypothetical protein